LDNLHLHKGQHRLASSSHFPIAAPEGQRRGIRQCPAGYWQISGNKKAGYLAAPAHAPLSSFRYGLWRAEVGMWYKGSVL
jgi:hypothetical protein